MRGALIVVAALAVLFATAAPAAPPEYPVNFIKVDELKEALDRGTKADIMADSRDYLMKVDAVGTDFQLYPIPNCGKGQPMQTKKLGNGGPTMRSRACLTGGR